MNTSIWWDPNAKLHELQGKKKITSQGYLLNILSGPDCTGIIMKKFFHFFSNMLKNFFNVFDWQIQTKEILIITQ